MIYLVWLALTNCIRENVLRRQLRKERTFDMTDAIIIVVLVLVVFLALQQVRKKLKSGGCCSGGSTTIRDKKILTAPKIGEKVLIVEGMHCENCEIRVENALNRLDGVLCKVNLKKKIATVAYSREVSDELLKETVEKLGYEVTSIQG